MKTPIWPLILIVIGVLFLAANLGLVSSVELRQLLATWWPLILIAIGVAGLLRRSPELARYR